MVSKNFIQNQMERLTEDTDLLTDVITSDENEFPSKASIDALKEANISKNEKKNTSGQVKIEGV